ncbi:MAG: tetratricopeptide repeat protein, partial [Acidobacteria bacterium]|nr:tetratricopeptide repeat protein [Acidobacteriota bacterium]
HEALLVRWPRIRELIEVDRRDYETLDRVTSAWSLWAGTPPHQKNKRLLTELALAEGNDLIQRWGIDVDEGVRQFVHASHVHARARQSSRRRLVAGVVLSLAVLTVVASSTALVAYRARNAALIAQSAALRDAATAKEVTGFLVGLFKDVDPGQARGKTLLAREVLDHGLQKIRTDLKNEPAVRAEVLEAIGTVYSNLGLYTAGEAALRESLSLAETSPDSTPLSVANARKALAFAIVDEGKLAEAESLYQLAIDYYDTVPKLRIEATDTRSDLGYAYWSDAKYEKGIEVLTEARDAAIGLTGPSSDLTAGILFTLGQTLFSRGEREQGLKLEIEANRITRQVHGEDYYWYAAGLYEIGFALQQMQRVPEAADYFSRSIPILEKVLGPDHPWLSIALYGYGGVLSTQGKHAAAVAALVRSLAIAERAGVAQSRDADNARLSLAEAYIATGEYARAIPLSQAVVSNTLRREGDNSPEYQAALHNLGVELRRAGHAEAAIPPLRRALELKERLLPGNAWSMRISLGALADALCVKTPNDEGLSLARRARSLDVKDATSWEADIFAAIYAYCDPVATNRKENEQVLLTSLQHVKDARGNNSPQTRDMLFRLMRFYRAAGELGSAGRYQQLLRTAVKQSSAGT